MSYGEGARSA